MKLNVFFMIVLLIKKTDLGFCKCSKVTYKIISKLTGKLKNLNKFYLEISIHQEDIVKLKIFKLFQEDSANI
jgi:hypothetical protein